MKYLVTGNAGFVGFHTAKALLERGEDVVGFDCVNAYYDVGIKEARLKILDEVAKTSKGSYTFYRENLADKTALDNCFKTEKFDRVINLAAQAGVRHSLTHPEDYVESNIIAFTNLLEACRHNEVGHLVYASTSSVYGANTDMSFSEQVRVHRLLPFYAASKRATYFMAHASHHLFRHPTTVCSVFTIS